MKKYFHLLFIVICLLMFTSCLNESNVGELEESLKIQTKKETVSLEELTKFKWETVYFIASYMSKSEIQSIIGIESDEIIDNNLDESVLYLIFINKGEVVYQIYGRKENLGFEFIVGKYKDYFMLKNKESIFSVDDIDREKIFTLKK